MKHQLYPSALMFGTGNLAGLADLRGVVTILGGTEQPRPRGGLVNSFTLDNPAPACDNVSQAQRPRDPEPRVRKADHYSGNILTPLGLDAAVRGLCAINSMDEVRALLTAMKDIAA